MPIVNRIADFHHEMTAWRRDLHEHPETSFEEVRTSGIVAEKLQSWGIEVHRGLAKTGVVGVLHGQSGAGGKSIGLRADMDALPMTEENDLPYKSRIPGKMHGCGHDGHTVMLLGAARYLAETRNFSGTVYFIFQPAEEGGGGARVMIEEGLLEKFPMDSVWGMHNWPNMPAGTVALRSGPVMAAPDQFDITVHGRGGHGAYPHATIDPVIVGAHVLTALQTIVSRNANPIDNIVVSATKFHAGEAYNVIPESAVISGTIRTYRPETRDFAEASIRRIAPAVAAAFGATATVAHRRGYPATVNSAIETEFAAAVADAVVGESNVDRNPEPSMGAEDFAYMLEKRPGSYIWLGAQGGPAKGLLHNPRYDFNDEILPIGASYWAKLVETALPR